MTATQTRPSSVKEAIETRRSIRKFVQEPLDQADLREILRLASLAPSAKNVQTWRVAVIQNPDLQTKLQAAPYNQGQVTSAPAVLVVYSDMENTLNTIEQTLPASMSEEGRQTRAKGFARTSPEWTWRSAVSGAWRRPTSPSAS